MNGPADGPPDPGPYLLRLFVAGNTVLSQRAIGNLRRICEEHLPGRVSFEVIDIYQQPELAGQHQVVAAPTLVKLQPPPVRHIVGDLSGTGRVLQGLGLPAPPENGHGP